MVFYSHNFSDKEAICSYLKKILSEDHQKHRTMREKLKHKDEDIAVETLLLSFRIQLSVYILIFWLFYNLCENEKNVFETRYTLHVSHEIMLCDREISLGKKWGF